MIFQWLSRRIDAIPTGKSRILKRLKFTLQLAFAALCIWIAYVEFVVRSGNADRSYIWTQPPPATQIESTENAPPLAPELCSDGPCEDMDKITIQDIRTRPGITEPR
ncbi:MAG: hypothetical protein AAGE61_21340 [Pseudomonadota bacterium]